LQILKLIRTFKSIFCCLLFIIAHSSYGQQPVFKNYSVKDGLPSSEVYQVMQDSKGYMWFCTDAGVSRYDGYSFRNFSSRNGLKDNTVFGAFEDRKGRVWFRTMSGRLFYFLNDSIFSIEANKGHISELQNGLVSSVYVDTADTVWCGEYRGQGFFKIAPPYRGSDCSFYSPTEQAQCAYFVEIDKLGFIWGTLHYGLPVGTAVEIFIPMHINYSESGQ
jgi:ligand-binding sensor domain-containing protein